MACKKKGKKKRQEVTKMEGNTILTAEEIAAEAEALLQTTFNTDPIEVLVEEGEIENVQDENQ